MAFKFAHTSDWHFGAARRLTPKSTDYLERHKAVLRSFIELCKTEKVDFVLVAGDLFENASTTIEELVAAYEIFSELGDVAPVIATAGNHDELNVGVFQTQWLKLLNIANVHFVDKPQVVTVGRTGGASHILAMPWTGIKEQEQFTNLILSHMGVGEVEIAMLHECFIGVTLDSGISSKGGVKIPDIPSIRYYACGDIHKHQRVHLPHAFYSGAPLQYNFGDGLPKGCMIVDVDDQKNYKPRFVPLPQPIELHNISSLDEIPSDSPHWYKLRCEASRMPRHLPANVKATELIAKPLEMPKAVVAAEGEEVQTHQQAVDFTEGVAELLEGNGFTPEEIQATKEQITEWVRG